MEHRKSVKWIIAVAGLAVLGLLGYVVYNSACAQSGETKTLPPTDTTQAKPISPTAESETDADIEKKGGRKLAHGGVLYLKDKRIEIPAIIANPNKPLDLFGCAEGGKDYETVVVLKCEPKELHLALIFCGLKEGKGPKSFGDATKPTGDLVLITLEWEGADKKIVSYPAEDLIIDIRTKETWPRVGWSFTGSAFEDEIDYDTGQPTGRKIYLASATKTIIAIYHDPAAILDNPTASGGVDNIYQPNKKILPPSGTPAKMIITVPSEKELADLKKTNDDVAKKEVEWQKKWEEELEKQNPPKPPEDKPAGGK